MGGLRQLVQVALFPGRSATVLGLVGAGGIGQILWEYIRGFYYTETAAVMIVIVVTVSLLDILSQRLRRMLI